MKIMCNCFVLTPVSQRLEYGLHSLQTSLIIITQLLPNDSKGLKGVSGSMLLQAEVKRFAKGMFLYSAVSSPLDRSECSALPPGRPAHSDTNSTSLGSILATQQ